MDNCLLDVVMKKCQDNESYVRSTSVKSLQVHYYTQVLGIDTYVKRITLNNPTIWESKEKLVLFNHMIKLLEDNDISPRRFIECMFCLHSIEQYLTPFADGLIMKQVHCMLLECLQMRPLAKK
jgi:hypothetical protein